MYRAAPLNRLPANCIHLFVVFCDEKKNAFWLSFTEVRVRVVTHSNNNSQQRVLCDLISSVSLAIRAVFVFFLSLRRLTFGFKSECIGTLTQASEDAV